jgi:hypothetical protein
MNQPPAEKKKVIQPMSVVLPPDQTILMQARMEAGQRNVKLKNVASLLLHEPVLTMEFLQSANSALFSGAPALDLDTALMRLGSARVIVELGDMFLREQIKVDSIEEVFYLLRYQSRRVSIVSLIIASALRPQLAATARISGLLSEIGHMVALLSLGQTYVDVLTQHKRKNLAFRLEKDHKFNIETIRIKYLRSKGIPEKLILPYDLEAQLKTPGDVDLRACIRSAIAIIDAFDNGKMSLYNPDQPLPSQSELRLFKMTPIQHERLYKTLSDYLKKTADHEAPASASMLISSSDQDDVLELNEEDSSQIKVPHYPISYVKPQSRTKLEDFFKICESAMSEEQLKNAALESLIRSGFFSRAALIRVPPESNKALIEESLGFEKPIGPSIEISDPLSPFNLFRLDIKSFNSKTNAPKAPFGCSAFAIGPIALSAVGEKILLYADASQAAGLTMDCRGAFRLAMNLLASKFQSFKTSET